MSEQENDIPTPGQIIKELRAEIAALTILANGCSRHPSYRAKRKVVTICEPCNAMWDARQRLAVLQGGVKSE